MTVAELIADLARHDPGALVVLALDPEGHDFALADMTDRGVWVPLSRWSGMVKLAPDQLTDALRTAGYTEEDIHDGPDGQKAVMLWPVN